MNTNSITIQFERFTGTAEAGPGCTFALVGSPVTIASLAGLAHAIARALSTGATAFAVAGDTVRYHTLADRDERRHCLLSMAERFFGESWLTKTAAVAAVEAGCAAAVQETQTRPRGARQLGDVITVADGSGDYVVEALCGTDAILVPTPMIRTEDEAYL